MQQFNLTITFAKLMCCYGFSQEAIPCPGCITYPSDHQI